MVQGFPPPRLINSAARLWIKFELMGVGHDVWIFRAMDSDCFMFLFEQNSFGIDW